MLTIHSPKFAAGRAEVCKNSPSYRHRRAPSAIDTYTVESAPGVTAESPAKLSEGRKKKSQMQGLKLSGKEVVRQSLKEKEMFRHSTKEKGTKEIISSIQSLKEEYRELRAEYQELIKEKLKNTSEMNLVKAENDRLLRDNERLKLQISFLQQENERTRRECLKLLEVEKFKAQKLEESLSEKEDYINQTLLRIRTDPHEHSLPHQEVSLTISQDRSALFDHPYPNNNHDNHDTLNNQSQFLSFSLTSVLEESTDKEPLTQTKREHAKAASEVPLDKPREVPSFRKPRKEVPRIELGNAQSKLTLVPGMTPGRQEKKGSKSKTSKSFREKENRETLNQHQKKKSKKLINLSGVSDV